MKGSLKLIRLAGVNIYVHWTFSLLLAFILFRGIKMGYDTPQLLWSVLFILSIFFIVVLHELGHSLAARKFGIPTKDITLLPIGGVARLEKMPEKPMEELVVAIAGPLVNVVLAFILYLFVEIPSAEELTEEVVIAIGPQNFLFNLFIVNIILAVFNMIPAFPMDGGRVLRALLSIKIPRHKATFIAARVGQVLAILFIIGGFYGNPFLILIGLFIIFGAQAEAQQTKTNYMLKGATLDDVLMQQYETLNVDDSIHTAVKKLLDGQSKNFVVLDNGEPVGSLNRDEMIKTLSEEGLAVLVKDAMNPELLKFPDTLELEEAYRKMMETNASIALIFDKGNFKGIVDTENILEFILVKSALEK
jgi:Zn-dependent protease/CBS domain-containing protein